MDKITFRLKMRALQTILGIRTRGVFVPYRHAGALATPGPYAAIEPGFAAAEAAMTGVLNEIAATAPALAAAFRGRLAGHAGSGYFGRLDAAAAYAMVRRLRPARIVEVGSGSSTHVLAAAGATLEHPPEIVCIDPMPRSDIAGLGVEFIEGVLDETHLARFEALGPGDIAFFDSSHVLMQGSDVDIIQNRILPLLGQGVSIHIHDIFLPDAYPEAWAHRVYSEQQGLVGWLATGGLRPVFSSHYAATRLTGAVEEALSDLASVPPGAAGTSLWLARGEPPLQ